MAGSTRSLTRLRKLVADWPESCEVEAWGHPTFRAGKKIFAGFGEHEGRPAITVKSTHAEQQLLCSGEGFFVPPYVGKQGWVGILVDDVPWPQIADLVEASYRAVALKRMLAEFDPD